MGRTESHVAESNPAEAAHTGVPFHRAAAAQVRSAQAAWTDLLGSFGLGDARPSELGRRLGLDKTLAWKIVRFSAGADALSAAKHMPGSGGVGIALDAATARGVADAHIHAVREADRALREFVRVHAGDRRTFEAMLAGAERDEAVIAEERKAFYQAGSAIWGVRARVQFLTLAIKPSEDHPDLLDGLYIGGLIDLERLRPDVPWIVRRLRAYQKDALRDPVRVVRTPLVQPSSPARDGPALALVPEFCSQPAPEIRQFEGKDGWVFDEVAPGPVGRRGAVTCVLGEAYSNALPHRWSEDNREAVYALTLRTPVEAVVYDLLVHRSLEHFGDAETREYGLIEDRPTSFGGAGGSPVMLAEPRPAASLGQPPVLSTRKLAGYTDMVSRAFELRGWGGAGEFRGYRAELEYPPVPSDLKLVCPISRR